MTKCPEKYKNLTSETFGEGKYVTEEILHQFCKNDAYLYSQMKALWDTTPPVSRKRFTPLVLDSEKSFGVSLSSDNNYLFSDSTGTTKNINFISRDSIDAIKTTAHIDTKNREITLPLIQGTLDKTTKNNSPWGDMICNEFWYISFDKSRTYETRPHWLREEGNCEIPAVCRAQTFKAKKTGLLEAVVLNLKGNQNTGSPLSIEIRKCINKNNTWYPAGSGDIQEDPTKLLAREDIVFTKVNPGVYSVAFRFPPLLDKNSTYAIVLRSPLTHQTDGYMVGGWSKYCDTDGYPEGNAFLSENNGCTWIRYGKKENVSYHMGQQAPEDFAFEAHIRQISPPTYPTNTNHYVYLKPIFSNPVTQVILSVTDENSNSPSPGRIIYEVSQDGRRWSKFDSTFIKTFEEPAPMTFIRALMRTSSATESPIIKNISVSLVTNPAKKSYARTKYYFPGTGRILGANVWSKFNAPFVEEPSTKVEVDVIRNLTSYERYYIINPLDIKGYGYLEGLDPVDLANINTDEEMENYILSNPTIINILSNNNIYVIGYIGRVVIDNEIYTFPNIRMRESPAYPLIYVGLQPIEVEDTKDYGEWFDYIVDYDEDIITLSDDVKEDLIPGTLTAKYNPLFIKGVKSDELPLCLDLFTETFRLSREDIAQKPISLKTRVSPLDPLREVLLNPETEAEKKLIEDVDFTVNYDDKEISMNIDYLTDNDIIQIKYTPFLTDVGIALAYRLSRENTDKQAYLKPNYIEYKT